MTAAARSSPVAPGPPGSAGSPVAPSWRSSPGWPLQVRVALDALEHDAGRWELAAQQLQTAADAAAAQRLEPSVFSFAGAASAAAYQALQARTVTLLTQGAQNLAAIAATLRACAEAYTAAEQAHVDRLNDISWPAAGSRPVGPPGLGPARPEGPR